MLKLLRETRQEFDKVIWPSRQETMRLTVMVIGVSLFVGVFVAGADYLFKELLGVIIAS